MFNSSVSGILATLGQSDYAAANSSLESLARHRLAAKNIVTSVVLPMVLGLVL